eukprot:gnl/Dysnectes_brevis/864_a957_5389.p1 GENE.gnl/Dysnectes_brevis/864_a957_5389~~gnl/Dysnectes_brevis/864_a957_5389.p1  ORF type:complete len:166 (-),score=12.92 gnl/Dysnectes_brevis/864_a957_5389:53-550(-)
MKQTSKIILGFLTGVAASVGAIKLIQHFRDSDLYEDEDDYDLEKYTPCEGYCKLVILARTDAGMKKGKLAAQCGHASVQSYRKGVRSHPSYVAKWVSDGQMKIVLKVTDDVLDDILAQAKTANLPHGFICDAGHTQVAAGTRTVGYIGPCPRELVDTITSNLKLM